MSTYDICIDREAAQQQTTSHKIRRPIPRHARLIPKNSGNSCEHNCQCIHSNPPAPTLPFQNHAYHELRSPMAVENHYIVTTSSEHSQMTNAVCPCECGSSLQGPSSLQSGRSSAVQQMLNGTATEEQERRCHHSKQPSQTESSHSQRLQTPVQLHHPPPSQEPTSLRNTPQITQQDEQKYSTCPHSSDNLYNNGTSTGIKVDEIIQSEEEIQGPPLPPRPPLRPRNTLNHRHRAIPHTSGVRKYVIWCLICGGTSLLLGLLFLAVYFLIRSYTSTVSYFETVPSFVPATLLILTGLCIMSLARRRNRYSYLIKLSGAFGLASALTCALVTVTTTVLHMSRLQSLRECEYQQKTRTCTCYTQPQSDNLVTEDPGIRFVFDSTTDCDVVHGALYSCLRAVFGLSVAGVLVAVFSCMLVYQLLSHERKKMYWEQLELRCRSLYSTQPPPSAISTVGPIIGTPRNTACRCCEQCHAHRNAMAATATYPWDGDTRFWLPGQAGNFYSPNPGSDEHHLATGQRPVRNNNRAPGWSWPRMPWQRANDASAQRGGFRQTPSSPDSQYGFSNNTEGNVPTGTSMTTVQSNYTLINAPYGVWGPPPPYSDPNSPARRITNNGRYQYISPVPMQCQPTTVLIQGEMQVQSVQNVVQAIEHHPRTVQETSPYNPSTQTLTQVVPQTLRKQRKKDAPENNQQSDSDGPARDKFSNTLPVRKVKKRHVDHGVKSISGANAAQRVNVQEIFRPQSTVIENEYNEPNVVAGTSNDQIQVRQSRRTKISKGVENTGFQEVQNRSEDHKQGNEVAESEVYFGDVSSCCNISVQNDNFYDDNSSNGHRKRSTPNTSSSDKSFTKEDDDYLAQRFGKREPSVRSRLPFPQIPELYDPSPVVSPRTSLIPKDVSRQSMCSVDSSTGDKTDYTDLSPATPMNPPYPTESSPFVASSFPYSSSESQEAHKRLTKNLPEVFLNDKTNDTSPLTMINYDSASPTFNFTPQNSSRSPKNFKMAMPQRSHRSENGDKSLEQQSWQEEHDRRL